MPCCHVYATWSPSWHGSSGGGGGEAHSRQDSSVAAASARSGLLFLSTAMILLLSCLLLLQAFLVPVGGSKPSEKFVEANVKASPGVQTSSYFPKNPLKVVKPGERTQVDIDVINDGQAPLKVIYTRASIHLPHDHRLIVQNFTVQEGTTIVTTGSKGSYSYSFSSNKLLQAGIYDLVGYVVYEIDGGLYKNVFHNGSIDVLENGGFVKGETIFLCSLGLGILGLLGMWAYSQAQNFLKKRKRSYKRVETGTRSSSGALTNDWLQGTSYTQRSSKNTSQQRQSIKKKNSSKDS